MKSCIVCGVGLNPKNTKPYRIKNYIHKCNECVRVEKALQSKAYSDANPGLCAKRSVQYKKRMKVDDPVKYSCMQMSASSKKRAKAYGWDNDIDTEYLLGIAVDVCPIIGVRLKYGGGEKTKLSCSLDRIDPLGGYVRGNVQIISNIANLMKSNASLDELKSFAKWVDSVIKSAA